MESIYRIESIRATGARGITRLCSSERMALAIAERMIWSRGNVSPHYYKVSVYRDGLDRAITTLSRPAFNPFRGPRSHSHCSCDVRLCMVECCGAGESVGDA